MAYEAYQQRTGQPVTPETVCDIFGAAPRPGSPGGEPWDPDDDDQQLRRRWPRLFAWHQSGALP